MKKTKKGALILLLGVILTGITLFALTGCGGGGGRGDPNRLVVWSFTDELQDLINTYFRPRFPDMVVEYSLTPSDQFPARLDPVLRSGVGAPDVFALEADFIRRYVESGLLLDLTDIANEVRGRSLDYPIEIGTHNGRVYAMSWQATPGALFYRRSMAREYLGTDDPEVVQTYFSNMNRYLETARLLRDRSANSANGRVVVIGAIADLMRPFNALRQQPWVVNNSLHIDPAMQDMLTLARTLRDENLDGRIEPWSEQWFAGMNGTMRDEFGNPVQVFSYFLPTWGLHYVLVPNAPNTAGDWAMIPGPAPWWWGGTWLAAYSGTGNPEGARELIRLLTTNEEVLEQYARRTGDFVSHMGVVNRIKDDLPGNPFLGGQNHYVAFAEMAPRIRGNLLQGTDQAIQGIFSEAITSYVNNEQTREVALQNFRDMVRAQLGH